MRWVIAQAQTEGVKVDQDAARELVDALGADMMLVSRELEKLVLYSGEKKQSRWATWKPWVLGSQAALAL